MIKLAIFPMNVSVTVSDDRIVDGRDDPLDLL